MIRFENLSKDEFKAKLKLEDAKLAGEISLPEPNNDDHPQTAPAVPTAIPTADLDARLRATQVLISIGIDLTSIPHDQAKALVDAMTANLAGVPKIGVAAMPLHQQPEIGPTISEAVAAYLSNHRQTWREKTYRTNEAKLRLLEKLFGSERRVTTIKVADLWEFADGLARVRRNYQTQGAQSFQSIQTENPAGRIKASTAINVLSCVKSFFRWLTDRCSRRRCSPDACRSVGGFIRARRFTGTRTSGCPCLAFIRARGWGNSCSFISPMW
ncbi:MAG: hypothetical protein ABMA01_19025 [Chthoniobacteraceae bacterium]